MPSTLPTAKSVQEMEDRIIAELSRIQAPASPEELFTRLGVTKAAPSDFLARQAMGRLLDRKDVIVTKERKFQLEQLRGSGTDVVRAVKKPSFASGLWGAFRLKNR
jgi:hypothetical protein